MDPDFHTKLFSVTSTSATTTMASSCIQTRKERGRQAGARARRRALDIRGHYQLIDEVWDGCRAIVEPSKWRRSTAPRRTAILRYL